MSSTVQRLSSLALFLFCSFILLVSLFTSNRVEVGQLGRLPSTRIYVSDVILPDNALYLPVMARDRVRLFFTPDREQVFLKLEYAHTRYKAAQALAIKGQGPLAITTMTKSQKYLLQAVYQVRADKEAYTPEERLQVKTALTLSIFRIEQLRSTIETDDSVLGALQAESAVVLEQFDIL